jgi:hypothetical protein
MERRHIRWKKWTTVALATVTAALLILIATGAFNSAPSTKPQTVGGLVRLMRTGANSAYVATYEISNYAYFSSGTLTVANMPPAPGIKSHPNIDGYASTLETSYVFRGANGHIAQWIQDKTNVSACSNGPFLSGKKNLECSRPFAYIPSNGFAEESMGFLPSWQLNDFGPASPSYSSSIVNKSSRRFGELQCILLRQGVGAFRQTTCVDHRGLLVLWTTRKGAKLLGRAQLMSLSYHPTAKNFITLEKPTKAMILPPF